MNLILASKSPRRKEILSKLGYTFCVIPALKDEVFKGQDIDAALKNVALSKVKEVFEKHNNDCIIGADTIVVYDGQILQKPVSKTEAFITLKMLSGKVHEVKTAVALCSPNHEVVDVVTTKVYFKELSDDRINDYVNKGTCMDKAGSYGIQEVDFVERIEGSYSNVVGFPKYKVQEFLEKEKDHLGL